YQLPNPHGDNTLITDETGAQVYSEHYDSFGNSLTGGGLGYGYTGKWQRDTDSSTGTVRMGVREHDPVVGRLTSADPLKGDAMNPQSLNRYGYALNNPMTTYDLDGRQAGELQKLIELSFFERQYNFGGGEEVHLEMCQLDFSCIREEDFPRGIGSEETIDLSVRGCEQGLALGQLDLIYLGDHKVKSKWGKETYDFDTGGSKHPWFESPYKFGRNVGTVLGHEHAGPGTPYDIYFEGEGTIAPNRSWWQRFLII
ncbi:MAG: RHS repeat-associated core domain-containing protein, partial [Thermoleophilia bacterium]